MATKRYIALIYLVRGTNRQGYFDSPDDAEAEYMLYIGYVT